MCHDEKINNNKLWVKGEAQSVAKWQLLLSGSCPCMPDVLAKFTLKFSLTAKEWTS